MDEQLVVDGILGEPQPSGDKSHMTATLGLSRNLSEAERRVFSQLWSRVGTQVTVTPSSERHDTLTMTSVPLSKVSETLRRIDLLAQSLPQHAQDEEAEIAARDARWRSAVELAEKHFQSRQ